MIGLKAYWMGRDVEYPPTPEMEEGANTLLNKVEGLLYDLGIEVTDDDLASGYRPGKYNVEAGGSINSCHLKAVALDIRETEKREISGKITEELLKKHDLYMEDPKNTIKIHPDGKKSFWCHLQTRATRRRIFLP